MKHQPLILSRLDGVDIEYDITTIENIIDDFDRVTIIFKDKSREILKKDDYLYFHWDSFREDIRRRFVL